jgi:hypothetical protein
MHMCRSAAMVVTLCSPVSRSEYGVLGRYPILILQLCMQTSRLVHINTGGGRRVCTNQLGTQWYKRRIRRAMPRACRLVHRCVLPPPSWWSLSRRALPCHRYRPAVLNPNLLPQYHQHAPKAWKSIVS